MNHGERRRALLVAALGFLRVEPRPRELRTLHAWLDNWNGIGLLSAGMARQAFDLQLTWYDERGWRATFYTTGMEHSATSATGSGWASTPWSALQRAAWQALERAGQSLTDSVAPLDDCAPR